MSHQSDFQEITHYKQRIKLLPAKVNHRCEDFIPILERPFSFSTTKTGILEVALFQHFQCCVYYG